jgi:hypothetical protein
LAAYLSAPFWLTQGICLQEYEYIGLSGKNIHKLLFGGLINGPAVRGSEKSPIEML